MFSREDTKALKGLAVLMMMLLHLAAFPDRAPVGFAGFRSGFPWGNVAFFSGFMAQLGICISIFFFLGGYGLYKRWRAGRFDLLEQELGLYKNYWKVFCVMVPIGFLFFARSGPNVSELASRYVIGSYTEWIAALLANFTGLSFSFNDEWWFFFPYVCILPLGLFYCRAFKKPRSFAFEIYCLFALHVLLWTVLPRWEWLKEDLYYKAFFRMTSRSLAFFSGIVFAKHDMLVRLKTRFFSGRVRWLACPFLMAALLLLSNYVVGDNLDILFAPAFCIMASCFFDHVPPLKKAFVFLGRHSMNLWLTHSFFCYYFLEATWLVYCTRNPWLSLLILLGLSLGASLLIDAFYSLLGKGLAALRGLEIRIFRYAAKNKK